MGFKKKFNVFTKKPDIYYQSDETDPLWAIDKPSYSTKAQADLLYAPISVTQYTDEMAQDAVGGVVGTGLAYDDPTGVISCTITQYTDSDAISAIQGDASWNASDWDTAYGWGNHAGLYLPAATVLAQTKAAESNKFLTAYNATTGAFTNAQPTWANIDKTTSDIADITTKSHTSLSDIGTLTHATIDSYLDQAVLTTSSPTFAGLTLNGALYANKDGAALANRFTVANDAVGSYGYFEYYRSRGTNASPTALQNGDYIGGFTARPYDGSGYLLRANINFVVDGTVDDGTDAAPTKIIFATGTTSNPTTRLTIASDGNATFKNNLTVNGGTVTLGVDTNFVLSGGVNGVSFDTSTLSVDAANHRVGVGITTPTRSLHLAQSTSSTNSVNSPFLLNTRSTGDMADGFGGGLLFGINDDTLTAENIIATIYGIRDGADDSGKLTFNTYKAGSRTERMVINSDGHITLEGVTSTGATGTGKFVFSIAPTLTGTTTFYATADVYSTIASGNYSVVRTADTNPALQTFISAGGVKEAQPKYVVSISGKNSWGNGTDAVDTNLYRSAANTLKTDDAFQAASYAVGTTAGIDETISYTKSGGGTGTLTFTKGILTASA